MITKWVLWIVALVLLAYDGIVGKISQPSESTVMREWGWKYNYFPFLMGVLIAHWFFPRQTWINPIVGKTIPFILLVMAWDLYWNKFHGSHEWFRYPGLWVILGFPIGFLFWAAQDNNSPLK